MTTTTSQRPWETSHQSPGSSPPPRGQLGQLPSISALTNELPGGPSSNGFPSPASTRERDSGGWSSQPQSTRSSGYSTGTSSFAMSSNTGSYYMSPNRQSTVSNHSNLGPTSHASGDYSIPPTSTGVLGSPGFASQPGTGGLLPSLNQHHDPQHRQSSGSDFPPQESRRSSIGSQVNNGMNSLQINGAGAGAGSGAGPGAGAGAGANSPYAGSVNHSSTSLAQNLQRERNIPGVNALRNSRSYAQLPGSPLSPIAADGRPSTAYTRIAPPIGHNPKKDIYAGIEPIPGQAYAFPDAPDIIPGALPPKSTSSRQMSHSSETRPTFTNSRRDSGHTSIGSSVVTGDSRLPPGQHRLDDGHMHHMDSEMDDHMPGTHHHTLQQNQMSGLGDDDEAMTPEEGAQPYSRTPALRVSHKMAERKRRSEMKDLFENLRSQIPSNQGSKSSKWEILTKATEYITQLENSNKNGHSADKQLRLVAQDAELHRREAEKMRQENAHLMHELAMARQQTQQPTPPQQAPPPAQPAPMYPAHYVPPPPPPAPMHDPSRSLPPLNNPTSALSSMQGVQYTHEHR